MEKNKSLEIKLDSRKYNNACKNGNFRPVSYRSAYKKLKAQETSGMYRASLFDFAEAGLELAMQRQ